MPFFIIIQIDYLHRLSECFNTFDANDILRLLNHAEKRCKNVNHCIETLAQAQSSFLEQVDINYSYTLAKKMEQFKSNQALGYRTAGSEAEFLTGEMLYHEMQKIGLQEVTKDGFTLDSWEFEKAKLSFTDNSGLSRCFELGGYQTNFDTQGEQQFTLVYAGRGTYCDLAPLDVRGKLVLIDINQRDEWWINYPAYQAYLRGAAAVIAVQDEGYAQVDSTALNSQDICGPANAAAFSMSKADAAVLKNLLATNNNCITVKFDAKSKVKLNQKSYNIVGKIIGKDPDSMILMSAHYDSYFAGFQDDNAAIALMMGIAKALLGSGYQPEKTLVFCAMAAEEWGVSNTRYDWSVGAYNQVFRIHPEWAGKVIANINFELPACAHDSQDVIRCVYELETYLTEFAKTVPRVEGAYPDGICIASPVLTWSDDFSIAISGIPSLVNDFAAGGFMQTHYHSQFDNDEAYDEPSYHFHHNLYGMLMLCYDRCAVAPLDFSVQLTALRNSMDTAQMNGCGAASEGLTRALDNAITHAQAVYKIVGHINSEYNHTLDQGDQAAAKSLYERYRPLNAALLKAFKFAEDAFVRLTWHDEPIFPHQHPQNNLACIAGALNALLSGNLTRALDPFIGEIDNNWYAFHFENAVFRYFSDYVLHQPAHRLMWGAGRVLGQEDLSDIILSLKAKILQPNPKLENEIARLNAARQNQQKLLVRTVTEETQAVNKLAHLLKNCIK